MNFSSIFTKDIKIILPKMLKIYVNNIELFVKPNSTVLEVYEIIGLKFLPEIFIVSFFFSLFIQVFSLMWRFMFNSTLINKKKIKIKPKKFRFKLSLIRKT